MKVRGSAEAKGSAPIQMMRKGLGEELWREKKKLALAWLEEALPKLKGALTSDAWLGGGGNKAVYSAAELFKPAQVASINGTSYIAL